MQQFLRLDTALGKHARALLLISGEPTRADIRRLIAMLTHSMELLPEAPDDPAVAERLRGAAPLLRPRRLEVEEEQDRPRTEGRSGSPPADPVGAGSV